MKNQPRVLINCVLIKKKRVSCKVKELFPNAKQDGHLFAKSVTSSGPGFFKVRWQSNLILGTVAIS